MYWPSFRGGPAAIGDSISIAHLSRPNSIVSLCDGTDLISAERNNKKRKKTGEKGEDDS